ncbi:MAG: hypothetical protein OH319_01425 [Candidatus Parvarchaeota archaeon]|nr:hypothetical protein [Candidatus Jingweiarchaeum tengchongense]MCW1299779.1 hypothetical protein [Candidatus Jingweiarchaeum tengchongense]MCW1304250.1 hypothetical protein [Candidatus Jingweiarchaeum tengchongense]MCW1305278.1 hypothetical protein [Candidatus Jingweiarchaeum tengchongense]MCW1310613.1 hypothetical protein [Candidatus Jingweiarchaeum tengchongense]
MSIIFITIFFYVVSSTNLIQKSEKIALEINGISRIIFRERNFAGNITVRYPTWKSGIIVLNNTTNSVLLIIEEQSAQKNLSANIVSKNLSFHDFILIQKMDSEIEVK